MDRIQTYISKKGESLQAKNSDQTLKHIIDLCLDTEDTQYYQLVLTFLDAIDAGLSESEFWETSTQLYNTLKNVLLLKKQPEVDSDVILESKGLEKSYNNGFFKLGPVDFTLKQNQIIGLVGENGNGKTTLLRCLARELDMTGGAITYYFPYTSNYELRTKLVFIPQRTPKWSGALLTNLKFAASCYGIHGDTNEMIVQLVIARMGIRKYRNLGWASLSSGYKMRFELARAILRKSNVMLIDEPLANLDIIAQQTVLDDLRGMVQSPFRPMGIVLSSQQLYEVERNSDNVIFLKEGEQKNWIDQTEKEQKQVVEQKLLIVEVETSWDITRLTDSFSALEIIDIQMNGGTYILSFPSSVTILDFQQLVLQKQIPLNYFRDISNSTRRFFLK